MAYGNRQAQDKLAWMGLKADDARLPEALRDAIAALDDARETIEALVQEHKPAPKGRRWMFSYRHGVAIALAEARSGGTTSYFD